MIEIKGAEKYIEYRSLPVTDTPGVGWVLLAIVDHETPHTQSNYDSSTGRTTALPSIAINEPYALYGKTRDDVLAHLENANKEVQGREGAAQRALKEAQALLADAQKEMETWKKSACVHEARCSETQSLLYAATASLRAMEADLGKVRDAVGGDRFKEILGRSTVKQ